MDPMVDAGGFQGFVGRLLGGYSKEAREKEKAAKDALKNKK